MLDKVVSILGAVFALGLVVTIHELGHFLAAHFFRVRVDVFSFGFGPRILGFKRGTTDYRISVLPLGGYVRMAGENPSEERTGAPDEFLSKPRWQRTIIALAGPAMNLLTAVVVFAFMFTGTVQEPSYQDKPAQVAAVMPGTPAEKAGIQAGDQLIEINGAKDPTWQRAEWEAELALPGAPLPVTIDRDGTTVNTFVSDSLDPFSDFGYPIVPAVVGQVEPGTPAAHAGIRPGDQILAADGQDIGSWFQLMELEQRRQNRPITLLISRAGHSLQFHLQPQRVETPEGPHWGVGLYENGDLVKRSRNVVEGTALSLWLNMRLTKQIFEVLGELFSTHWSAVLKQMVGPVGIVAASGQAARRGIKDLLQLMAFISLNLGILNLLPIPILDGGHILMLGVESTLRRDLSLRAKEIILQLGMVFLLILFAIVMYHDVLRLIPHQ
jgi:regulator of sigma E protease